MHLELNLKSFKNKCISDCSRMIIIASLKIAILCYCTLTVPIHEILYIFLTQPLFILPAMLVTISIDHRKIMNNSWISRLHYKS